MTKTNFAERMVSLTTCSCPCCTAPRVRLRQPWPLRGCSVPQGWGCFPLGDGGSGGQGQSRVTGGCQAVLCPPQLSLSHCHLHLKSELITRKGDRNGVWKGIWMCLNVTVITRCRRVKVSFCPCVYRCLRTDLFPDTWAMTWKEFRLQQILHRASMWPLGLNKGKSITLLPWWPWHSRAEECWCRWPRAGWWHRRRRGHPKWGSTHTARLPCTQQGHPGHARQPGWQETLSPPTDIQQN